MKAKLLGPFLFIFFIVFLDACSNPDTRSQTNSDEESAQKPIQGQEDLNVSVFLDLSDRISPTRNPNHVMEYWQRDLGYIQSITKAFEYHLENKQIMAVNDHIQLYFLPLPKDFPNINSIVGELNMTFTSKNLTKDYVNSISLNYLKYATLIYKKTLEEKEPAAKKGIDDYPGSDLFGFFKSHVKDYCIKEGYRNILFILTDGYVFFKGRDRIMNSDNKSNFLLSKYLKKWGFTAKNYEEKLIKEGYGLQVASKGLNNLEVYVIGIQPKQSWQLDVLDNYWINWLRSMGVKNFQGDNSVKYLKEAALPANLNESIQSFINK